MEYFEKPDEQQLKIIRERLGEDSNRFENNLKLFEEWMRCQHHLPQTYENNLLTTFLRGCKHDMERAKRKIEMYFVNRAKCSDFLQNRDPTIEYMDQLNRKLKVFPLPKLTDKGDRVTFIKLECTDSSEMDLVTFVRYLFMNGDVRVAEEVPVSGDIYILDIANATLGHCVKFISPLVHKGMKITYEAYPIRLKAILLLNAPKFAENAIAFGKQLLNKKVRERLQVLNSVENLLDYVPKDILPADYGGAADTVDQISARWQNVLVKRNKWFQQQDSVVATNIPKELEDKAAFNEMIGVDGSFRKLEID